MINMHVDRAKTMIEFSCEDANVFATEMILGICNAIEILVKHDQEKFIKFANTFHKVLATTLATYQVTDEKDYDNADEKDIN